MHFNLTDALLLYYDHEQVSATQVAIFKMISLSTRIQLKYVWISP